MPNQCLSSFCRILTALLVLLPWDSVLADGSVLDVSGYYSRHEQPGGMAESSGQSEFIRFYEPDRIIHLYMPFPYSNSLEPNQLRQLFSAANAKTSGSAYLRGDFDILSEDIVAHVDKVKIVDAQAMIDCSNSAPCRIKFSTNGMEIIKPGVVLEHITEYELIPD